MTMRTPTMSSIAVTINTRSFPTDSPPTVVAFRGRVRGNAPSGAFLAPERRRLHRLPDDPGQCDDRQDVGDHLDVLRRDRLSALKMDLERLGRGEEEAGHRHPLRLPAPEDRRCQGDEAAPRGHLVGELVLV